MLRIRKKQIVAGTAGILLAVFLIHFRKQALSTLCVFAQAACFSVFISPICRRLENSGVHPYIAALASILFFVFFALLSIGIALPYIALKLMEFTKNYLPEFMSYFTQIELYLERIGIEALRGPRTLELLTGSISGVIRQIAYAGIAMSRNIGKYIVSSVLSYYLVRDRTIIGRYLLLLIPVSYRSYFLNVLSASRNALMGYLSGIIKTSLFVFAATYIGLLLLRIPDAFFLSLQMALLEVLPYVGPFLASIPILLNAASGGAMNMLYVLILVVVVQQIESSFAGPYFTASSTAIPPIVALSGVFVFGTFFGIWGILLAIPVLTIVQSLIRSVVQVNSVSQT